MSEVASYFPCQSAPAASSVCLRSLCIIPKNLPNKICSPCSVLRMFRPLCDDYSCQTKSVDNDLMQDTFTIIDGLTSDVDARQRVHIAFSFLLWSVECVHISVCSGSAL